MPLYRTELHCHCQGDPSDTYLRHTIFETIDQACKVGLAILAITWHRRIFHNPEAVSYAGERGLLLIAGIEAEIGGRHIVVLNVAEGDISGEPTWEELRALRRRNPEVLTIAPHPYYPSISCLGDLMDVYPDCFDAVEWCRLHVSWLPSWLSPNMRAARWALDHNKPLIACSDAHSLSMIGRHASTIEAPTLSIEALGQAIRSGRITFNRSSLKLNDLMWEARPAVLVHIVISWMRSWLEKPATQAMEQ